MMTQLSARSKSFIGEPKDNLGCQSRLRMVPAWPGLGDERGREERGNIPQRHVTWQEQGETDKPYRTV